MAAAGASPPPPGPPPAHPSAGVVHHIRRPTAAHRLGVLYDGDTVVGVREGLPAERAGLAEGMRLITVAGRPVAGASTEAVRAAFTAAPAEFAVVAAPPPPPDPALGPRVLSVATASAASLASPARGPAAPPAPRSSGRSSGAAPSVGARSARGGAAASGAGGAGEVAVRVRREVAGERIGLRHEGPLIVAAHPGMPGARAGLQEGMRIAEVSGQRVPANAPTEVVGQLFGAAPLQGSFSVHVVPAGAPAVLGREFTPSPAPAPSPLARSGSAGALLRPASAGAPVAGGQLSRAGVPRAPRASVDATAAAATAAVLWELTCLAEAIARSGGIDGIWDGVWPLSGHAAKAGAAVLLIAAALVVRRLWAYRGLLLAPRLPSAVELARQLRIPCEGGQLRAVACTAATAAAGLGCGWAAWADWDACGESATYSAPTVDSATRDSAPNGCPPAALVWIPFLLGVLGIVAALIAAGALISWLLRARAYCPLTEGYGENPLAPPHRAASHLQLLALPQRPGRRDAGGGVDAATRDWARDATGGLLRRSIVAAERDGAETPPTDVEEIVLEDGGPAAGQSPRHAESPAAPPGEHRRVSAWPQSPRSQSPPPSPPESAADAALRRLRTLSGARDEGAGEAVSPPPREPAPACAAQRGAQSPRVEALWNDFVDKLSQHGTSPEEVGEASAPTLHDLLRELGYGAIDSARLQSELVKRKAAPAPAPEAAAAARAPQRRGTLSAVRTLQEIDAAGRRVAPSVPEQPPEEWLQGGRRGRQELEQVQGRLAEEYEALAAQPPGSVADVLKTMRARQQLMAYTDALEDFVPERAAVPPPHRQPQVLWAADPGQHRRRSNGDRKRYRHHA
eukprot:TRINITY_DN8301_c0_g1_i1.p1 TRINITY_DN8301_c0_g1~~TRINITY_DN8301_c0_g1_i1.p1  ORF type:complete len:855 (+),score=204.56 TRINITY_DN8301_c0_g1_i1:70-2634(+)